MSNDALILDLSANLAPVRRRSVPREAGLLLALGAIELGLFLGMGLMRPDMGAMIGSAYMLWKLGSLGLLAAVSSALAIRSFAPTAAPRRGMAMMLALSGLALLAGGFVGSGAEEGRSIVERLSPVHGMLCATAIVVLSLPMMAMLAVLMRRGAPAYPEGSALAVGVAAGTCGALVFAFCCPINDPLYIVVWYSAGCAAVTAIARWLLPRRFRL